MLKPTWVIKDRVVPNQVLRIYLNRQSSQVAPPSALVEPRRRQCPTSPQRDADTPICGSMRVPQEFCNTPGRENYSEDNDEIWEESEQFPIDYCNKVFRQNGKTIAERMRSPFVKIPVERLRVQQKLRMQRIMRLREVKLLY